MVVMHNNSNDDDNKMCVNLPTPAAFLDYELPAPWLAT
jgi:hypothetical protein